jgi:hypothetical protein
MPYARDKFCSMRTGSNSIFKEGLDASFEDFGFSGAAGFLGFGMEFRGDGIHLRTGKTVFALGIIAREYLDRAQGHDLTANHNSNIVALQGAAQH